MIGSLLVVVLTVIRDLRQVSTKEAEYKGPEL
jgi:hypothetical protein